MEKVVSAPRLPNTPKKQKTDKKKKEFDNGCCQYSERGIFQRLQSEILLPKCDQTQRQITVRREPGLDKKHGELISACEWNMG